MLNKLENVKSIGTQTDNNIRSQISMIFEELDDTQKHIDGLYGILMDILVSEPTPDEAITLATITPRSAMGRDLSEIINQIKRIKSCILYIKESCEL